MNVIVKFASGIYGIIGHWCPDFYRMGVRIVPKVLLLLILMNTIIIGWTGHINKFAKVCSKMLFWLMGAAIYRGIHVSANPMALYG